MGLFTLDLKEVEASTNFCPAPFLCGTMWQHGKSCVPSGWERTVLLTIWKARLWLKAGVIASRAGGPSWQPGEGKGDAISPLHSEAHRAHVCLTEDGRLASQDDGLGFASSLPAPAQAAPHPRCSLLIHYTIQGFYIKNGKPGHLL